jgi:hypothetical protein
LKYSQIIEIPQSFALLTTPESKVKGKIIILYKQMGFNPLRWLNMSGSNIQEEWIYSGTGLLSPAISSILFCSGNVFENNLA